MVTSAPEGVTSAPGGAVLRVEGAVKRFGGVTALAGADIDVRSGEILGLIGPNGSGKTTMVNCVTGLLKLDAGRIVFKERDVTRWSRVRRARAGIARTYQNIQLFPGLTVGENIEVALNAVRGSSAKSRSYVREVMEDFALAPLRRACVAELPYGLQRRVEIVRALVGRPAILLLDEPSAGLNDAETQHLLGLLQDVRRSAECSLLLIDHDMEFVVEASDRIEAFDEGRMIFEGAPEEALRDERVVEAYLGVA